MKTVKSIFSIAALLLLSIGSVKAQDYQTGYFLGGYQYAYRLNPAFQSEHSHAAVIFGQLGLSVNSNVGIDNFLFVKDGKTCLFLNDKVSSEEFLGRLNKGENNISTNVAINLASAGFWVKRNFFNIDLSIKSVDSVTLPYDLFRFLKDGTTSGTTFNLGGTGVRSKNYVELALGWSHNWNNFISGGARLKTLFGIAEAQAYMNNLTLTMDRDKWTIQAQGTLNASSPLLSMGVDDKGYFDYSKIGVNTSKIGLAGFGTAVDLGVSVNVLPWITASLSILDLGFMVWNREISGKTPEAAYTYEPSKGSAIDVMGGSEGTSPINEELDKIKAALENIYKFQPSSGAPKAEAEMLPFRMNVGAEIRLPWYDRLSLGLLYSMRAGQGFNWGEGRVSLNISPLDWLSLSGSTAFNDFFRSFGFGLSLHPGVFNIFFGADMIPGSIIPLNNFSSSLSRLPNILGIPASDLNFNAYMGITIAIGKRKVDYHRHVIKEEDD